MGCRLCGFLQKLFVVPASALALMAGAGLGLTTLHVAPAWAEALLVRLRAAALSGLSVIQISAA